MKASIVWCRRIMDHLPDEIILLIFKHASGYDLATSFQMVSARWNHLINETESIWKGDVRLKGISEFRCKDKLLQVLKDAPKLKYLQIGNPETRAPGSGNGNPSPDREEDSGDRTEDILETINVYNKEIEYLHIIDGDFPLGCFDCIRSIIGRPKFKRLNVTFDKLADRREKITRLRQIFGAADLPILDDRDINFRQRINFICRKKSSEWEITEDSESYSSTEFG